MKGKITCDSDNQFWQDGLLGGRAELQNGIFEWEETTAAVREIRDLTT